MRRRDAICSRWHTGSAAGCRAGSAVATIIANAMFAFVTGVSIAAAAAFSRIAYPEMRRYGYSRKFALGCIAGSACLGMLIPPSVLMIVWGVLTELSIGKLFIAGVLPGLLLARRSICAYVVIAALVNPRLVGGEGSQCARHRWARRLPRHATTRTIQPIGPLLFSTALVLILDRRRAWLDLARLLHTDGGRRRRRGRRADAGADQGDNLRARSGRWF